MQTTIVKWGNSRGIRLPKLLLDSVNLSDNDTVELKTENDSIIIKKSTRERITIEKLFENWDGGLPESFDWGELDVPVGREMI